VLSENNKNAIIKTGLYSHKPDVKYRGTLYADNLYWCMNWTFKPSFYQDGRVFMVDTYFNDKSIELTDENIGEFTLIFDFNEVQQESSPEEYNEDDIYHVAIDSGGMYCGGKYFRRKNAKRSKEKLIDICKSKLKSAEYDVKKYKRELEELNNGVHWKLK
jgi:hypothetical protein